ncbi:hypothetical protein GQ55_5G486000 [Panicum hallii var. hallii]|uniref:Uncharacterized protein n=1 Tax=Panicum hallii var. hallii TaxID=1504633 RepID=A0A2T7DRE1_9POAL|nr:hypothetical protein GQ55_5G486000 [Panicum hallii var. hallii]
MSLVQIKSHKGRQSCIVRTKHGTQPHKSDLRWKSCAKVKFGHVLAIQAMNS